MNALDMEKKHSLLWLLGRPVLSGGIVFLVYISVCHFLDVILFFDGDRTLAYADAYYQYLDFFAWFKDVLDGRQSIRYAFSSSLGQGTIGLYAYYLASPFHLLLAFFDKQHLQEFFNLLIGWKASACGVTMAIYIQRRYPKLENFWCVLLSVCYGLMTYIFEQGSNIMWLDGVYMLPLIALGIYYLTERGKGMLLSVTVAGSVLFNWYTGGINCIAAGILLLSEFWQKHLAYERISGAKDFWHCFLQFCAAILHGIALSACLFLPVVLSMRSGRGSSFDWSRINPGLLGIPVSFIKAYSMGERSGYGYPALFCGSVILAGTLGFFTLKNINIKTKVLFGGILGLCIACFYWRPLYMVFSLLKQADSYWYRYAYVVIFVFISTAALCYQNVEQISTKPFFILAGLVVGAEILLDIVSGHAYRTLFYAGILSFCILVALISKLRNNQWERPVLSIVACITVLELGVNGYILGQHYSFGNAAVFNAYNRNEIQLIEEIKNQDPGIYRLTQTMTRSMNYQATTANYNESMAFYYMAIENYTSCPQNSQLSMLAGLGYPTYYDCLLAKNTFLLPVDTLFSVRYLLSPYAVNGLQKTAIKQTNGKDVYLNPYVLPMAFKVKGLPTENPDKEHPNGGNEGSGFSNPFLRWNEVYSTFSGTPESIMEELDYSVELTDDGAKYIIGIPEGKYAVYGNIPWMRDTSSTLNLNGSFSIPYTCRQSVQAFYIPTQEGQTAAKLTYNGDPKVLGVPQFYGLNLDTFERMSGVLKKGAAEELFLDSARVSINTTGMEGEVLYTSIPFENGWRIRNNGQNIKPELFDNCLICIPLVYGDNRIEMEYHIPGMKMGLLLSGIALILSIIRWKRNRRMEIA